MSTMAGSTFAAIWSRERGPELVPVDTDAAGDPDRFAYVTA
jgi:hypothetical protein